VAASRVKLSVAVKVDCTCEVAVIVTTLLVGTAEGAVYSPLVVPIDPLPVPLTDQFTSVLLKFVTVAVHCEVPRTVTSVGSHDTVIVGVVVVELDPQELTMASVAISPAKRRKRSQRNFSRPIWNFDSDTRNPPARTTLIFLRNTGMLPRGRPLARPAPVFRRAPRLGGIGASAARNRDFERASDE
jgi:hypothetical protein